MGLRPLVPLLANVLDCHLAGLFVGHLFSLGLGSADISLVIGFVTGQASPYEVARDVIDPVPGGGNNQKGEEESHGVGLGDTHALEGFSKARRV